MEMEKELEAVAEETSDNNADTPKEEKKSAKEKKAEKKEKADKNAEIIAKLEAEVSAEKDKYFRVAAEYDNFRKRSINDKLSAVDDAKSKTITDFLSVIDNFERAMAAECSDENYKKGIDMIFNQYLSILTKLGVTEIEAMGVEFNPNFHNAINQITDENLPENTVAQVFQKGFMLGDKIIRPAMVVVANP